MLLRAFFLGEIRRKLVGFFDVSVLFFLICMHRWSVSQCIYVWLYHVSLPFLFGVHVSIDPGNVGPFNHACSSESFVFYLHVCVSVWLYRINVTVSYQCDCKKIKKCINVTVAKGMMHTKTHTHTHTHRDMMPTDTHTNTQVWCQCSNTLTHGQTVCGALTQICESFWA